MSSTQDPNAPAQDPTAAGPQGAGGQAFGFAARPQEEKYNTQYLVANMSKERRTTQFVILGVIAVALGAAMWLFLMPKDTPKPAPAAATQQAAPAAEEAKPAADEAAKKP